MKILFFGDISGKTGRLALQKALPRSVEKYQPDFVITNGENATHGKGINKNAYDFLMSLGIDCITGGDHIFDVPETEEIFKSKDCRLIRPANYPNRPEIPGVGWKVLSKNGKRLGIVNLQGRIFMEEGFDNPFEKIAELLKKEELKNIPIIVDFHTEATSEISAMGWYLDGQVNAVLGTHTHVQTHDERILPKGTAYISDVGMVGSLNSVLGVEKEIILKKFLTGLKIKHDIAGFPAIASGVFLEIEGNRAIKIEKISEVIKKI